MRKSLISSLLFCLIGGLAQAETWSDITHVTQLYPYAGGLIFTTDYANESLSSCNEGKRFSISIDHPNYQVMVSAMMTAYVAGKSIQFNVDSQPKTCMPTINRFQMVDALQ